MQRRPARKPSQQRTRRIGAPDSKTRALLLDAAEQIMLDEGYAAVTTRRVSHKAGLKPQLVHYYFRAMDDLFLEVFRRRAGQTLDRHVRILAESERPLRALWEFSRDARRARFIMEFAALANHRKAIRAEIARYAEHSRQLQLAATARALRDYGIAAERCPPIVLLVAISGVSQVLVLEEVLGMTAGHAETVAFIESWIDELEPHRRGAPGVSSSARRRSHDRSDGARVPRTVGRSGAPRSR